MLLSIMGEMNRVSGQRLVHGSISYVPQEAWVMSTTVRENVVLDTDFNLERYKMAIESTSLDKVSAILVTTLETLRCICIFSMLIYVDW